MPALIAICVAVPALTAKLFDVPVCAPAVRVTVIVNDPVLPIVTAWDREPFVNAAVVPPPALSVPVEVTSTVFPAPVNAVAVLPN